jgi:iron(III) transport system substrate-binding protein
MSGAARLSRRNKRGKPKEERMRHSKFSRRDVIKGASALGLSVYASPIMAAPPEPAVVTSQLIEAAKKEGKIAWYTSLDLPVAERVAKAFEAKYPGIAARVERTGAERVFQRIGQEYASRIHAVDVVQSSDAAHFIVWKREGILEPYVPEDVAKFYPAEHKDADGMFATFRAWLCVMGYNTNLVKAEDAPKSYADLLDPKWAGKIVKAHPGYSGTIMTATYQIARDLGWDYLEKLAKQRIMQVQSSADPPKKLALGERAVMFDGNEYNLFQQKEKGDPVEIIYPTEGTPLIIGPNGLMKNAPNPNAGRLFQSFCFTPECQQLLIDVGGLRSAHPHTKEKPGRTPFADIKKMKDDPAGVEKTGDEIKARYTRLFRV